MDHGKTEVSVRMDDQYEDRIMEGPRYPYPRAGGRGRGGAGRDLHGRADSALEQVPGGEEVDCGKGEACAGVCGGAVWGRRGVVRADRAVWGGGRNVSRLTN